jgi:hypothetical protein
VPLLPRIGQQGTVERSPPGDRSGLSPAWFWVSAGLTGVLGGATVISALDTQRRHEDFRADPSERLSRAGLDAQLRTNVLLAGLVASAITTAALGLFGVRWRSAERPPTLSWAGASEGARP